MHLKTLTLRGFKSFASATTLEFEPGITCVVGPNGSGKSNVVDALAWVMGEQGAKTLRGGKMEDVIFAGTSGRAPLGRAEVAVTIDNTDGKLPIDYSEVTISRTLFRSGGSEYAINGTPSRLLDVQDLLSDSGIGREMHVIIGQGQLDGVLHATPEERRGFIEEAAGILKHRKRKEKALRKLDAMQGNLTRLTDLLTEIRRQLGPLGKQAEVARRAQVIQHQVRDASARLLADELAQLQASFDQDSADERAMRERRETVEKELEEGRKSLSTAEDQVSQTAIAHSQASELWYRTANLRERVQTTVSLAQERVRLLGTTEEDHSGRRDLDELAQQLERLEATAEELRNEVAQAQENLSESETHRKKTETTVQDEQRRVNEAQRLAADRREGLAKLSGAVGEQRSRTQSTEEEIQRLQQRLAEVENRRDKAEVEFTALESTVAGVEEGEEGLDAEYEQAAQVVDEIDAQLAELDESHAQATTDKARWQAREEALSMSLTRKDGAGALLEVQDEISGMRGSVSSLLTIEAGAENAIAAALGPLTDAIAVDDVDGVVDSIRRLRDDNWGRASFLIGNAHAQHHSPVELKAADLPEGCTPAIDLVSSLDELQPALHRALSGVVVVPDLVTAKKLLAAREELIAVTEDGDVIGALHGYGGAHGDPSVLELQAAHDEAKNNLQDAINRQDRATFAVEKARTQRGEAQEHAQKLLAKLHDSDAKIAAVAENLGQLGSAVRAASSEAERITEHVESARARLQQEQKELQRRVQALQSAQEEQEETEVDEQNIDEEHLHSLQQEASEARTTETDARLNLRTVEERQRAHTGRIESLRRTIAAEKAAREKAEKRAAQRRHQAAIASAVHEAGTQLLSEIERALSQAADERETTEEAQKAAEASIVTIRSHVDELAQEFSKLTDAVHRDEVARTQQRVHIEQLQQRAEDELGLTADALLEEFGPDQMIPADPTPDSDEVGEPYVYVREEQEKRLRKAKRVMGQLGKVNPLALEEFSALEERHKFLNDQLQDLKKSREDLLEIIAEIDDRVEKVFTEAFADTAEQFQHVFSRLFPGGEGKLVLTDPANMLTTGIEVEARPAGKKVKRLSLLSGGERSLTAVAILVAIFKARPSPFYVLDEVEAALDDVNLSRLIELFRELRDNSQLIVITHQKRTMEVADALYGVTMRGDGVTTVISQRLTEDAEPAS